MKAYINAGKLDAGHARMLIGLPDAETLANEIVARNLNVRQVEAMARGSRRTMTIDIRPAVETLGWAEVIRQIGAELGEEKLLGALVGKLEVDRILAHLSAAQRRELKRRLTAEEGKS